MIKKIKFFCNESNCLYCLFSNQDEMNIKCNLLIDRPVGKNYRILRGKIFISELKEFKKKEVCI